MLTIRTIEKIIQVWLLTAVLFSQAFLGHAFASDEVNEPVQEGTISTLTDSIVFGENFLFQTEDRAPIGIPIKVLDEYIKLRSCSAQSSYNGLTSAKQAEVFKLVQTEEFGKFILMLDGLLSTKFDEVSIALWDRMCVPK